MLKSTKDFYGYLDEYIDYLKGEVAEGTRKKYVTLKKSLQKFEDENKHYHTITFSMIDRKFYDTFTKYLRNQERQGEDKRHDQKVNRKGY